MIMEKSNVGNNIIKLTQNEHSSLWFVVSKEVEINVRILVIDNLADLENSSNQNQFPIKLLVHCLC